MITLPMTVSMAEVRALWRWPVKGMGGESLPSVRVDGRGAGGDRAHAVIGPGPDGLWRRLTQRTAPRLAGWSAAYPFNVGANVDPASPPLPLATAPGGRTFVWNDPRLLHALEDDLGHPVRLHRDVHGLQHAERTLLICWAGADARALRANVLLTGDDALGEPGRVLECDGGVRLRVLRACPRGGAYARVLARGRLAVGAVVQ
jgi:hypothetical protein